MATLFERLSQPPPTNNRPKQEQQFGAIPRGPLLRPIVPPADPNSTHAERFLDFVVNRWPREHVRLREIQQFGPVPLRNRQRALAMVEQLVAAGWLERVEPRRHDTRIWRVVRGPGQ
jgi:hypothetical protein